jgi:hypothetical protein
MRRPAIFLLSLLLTTAVYANHYADTYVIPVAGHTVGVNGTWMSDLAIRNFGTAPLTVQILVIETGFNTGDNIFPLMSDEIPDGSVTVAANGTVLLEDVMNGYRGMTNATGALILGADRPFAVTSRAYNSMGGIGQTVPASRDFLDNSVGTIDNSTVVYIPGIVNNADARTNIGFVAGNAGSAQGMTIEISLRNDAGGVVGTRQYFVPPGAFAHHQFNIRSSIGNAQFDIGSADFRIVEGEGALVPYASVVDNRTGEAAYIMGQFPNSTPPSALSVRPNLFRQLFDKMTR